MAEHSEKVYVSHLRSKPWNDKNLLIPQEVFSVTSMLTHEEKRMLYYLALNYYSAQGAILDMGSFLGGSTICFAAALQQRALDETLIHSYDLFRLGQFELENYFKHSPPKDLKTREIFDTNLKNYHSLLQVHEGDILSFSWEKGPIELLFIDIAKNYKVFDHILLSYLPSLIPSVSLVIMQDYLWGGSGAWHHVVMEKLSGYFEYIFDTDINSVVFFLKKELPQEILRQCLWGAIPFEEK
ncbi:MAG TPA: class I SAM-dependent methyltransferase, partial [Nitrososphaera sp.]|nr:class I SAM-dependent methyltransferase [Nitrososphaera sp.]